MISNRFSRGASTNSRLNVLWRDLATALRQQMYFLGRDVLHPSGNLLLRFGFEKRASEGLKGTSCYRTHWKDGFIDLHGSCAGWYGNTGANGFVYVRPKSRCFHWLGAEPPIPGTWPSDLLRAGNGTELHQAAIPFLSWWIAYEEWIVAEGLRRHRDNSFHELRRSSGPKQWLPPAEAIRWLDRFRADFPNLDRIPRNLTPLSRK